MEIAALCERIEEQMFASSVSDTSKPDTESVNRVWKKGGKQTKGKFQGNQQAESSKMNKHCYRCGNTDHMGRDLKCPARGKICHKCKGRDHFSNMCKTVNQVEGLTDFAFAIQDDCRDTDRLNVCLGNVHLRMLVDSGASSNVIDENTWEKLKSERIKCNSYIPGTERNFFSYSSDQPLPVKRAFKCDVRIGSQMVRAEFFVIKGTGEPLLGRETAMKLGVLKIGTDIAAVTDLKQSLQSQYSEVFQGVGMLKTKQICLYIDQTVQPVAQTLRRIPFNLRGPVEEKIKELLEMDIIEEVNGPTPWVNPVVIVPKDNS